MSDPTAKSLATVLITGASSGLGALYADRFARRGHDLVLAARDVARLDALAARLRSEAGVAVEVVQADLTKSADLDALDARLRDDTRIGVLVNNAGTAIGGFYESATGPSIESLIALNVTAASRLAITAAQRFARSFETGQGGGAIINISSVVAFIPDTPLGLYAATKAFVQSLSQGLSGAFGDKGVYVQAVMPAATRTEIWERGGIPPETIPGMMPADLMVDAALVGFDRRELVTLPSLHDAGPWDAYEAARQALIPAIRHAEPAGRYRAEAPAEACAV